MRLKYEISITIVAVVLAVFLGHASWKLDVDERHIEEQQKCIDHIPSPMDVQRQLIANGYPCGTDGADGFICGPNSMTAWKQAICDQYYELSVARMPKEK